MGCQNLHITEYNKYTENDHDEMGWTSNGIEAYIRDNSILHQYLIELSKYSIEQIEIVKKTKMNKVSKNSNTIMIEFLK